MTSKQANLVINEELVFELHELKRCAALSWKLLESLNASITTNTIIQSESAVKWRKCKMCAHFLNMIIKSTASEDKSEKHKCVNYSLNHSCE
jgi:hypothetical protein